MREYFVWLAKILTFCVVLFVIVPALLVGTLAASKGAMTPDSFDTKKNQVAVIELNGEISDTQEVLEELYKQANNPKIEAIVLRVDSPGGAVAPSQDIYGAVMKLKEKKPIVSSMGAVAASGGFYAAIGASKVVAQPGTMTGSIGFILQVPNLTRVMNLVGVEMITIKSGKLKDAGNMFRPMASEETEYLENTAHTVHEQFIRDVAGARKLPIDKVREFADGRVIMGEDAKNLGLVDEFGSVYDAARVALSLKGITLPASDTPELFYPKDSFKEFKKYFKTISTLPQIFSKTPELRFDIP